jgi:hypothetical protein
LQFKQPLFFYRVYILCQTLSHIGMLDTISFWIISRDPFQPTQLRPYSVLLKNIIWLGVLHESCSPGFVDEFGFLNCLISITEAQDISFWISSVKIENPAARRILARVCRSHSRSKWDQSFSNNTSSKSLTCVLWFIFNPHSRSRTLTWRKTITRN